MGIPALEEGFGDGVCLIYGNADSGTVGVDLMLVIVSKFAFNVDSEDALAGVTVAGG